MVPVATSTRLAEADSIAAQVTRTRKFSNPIVGWHLLSLDAPTVAMLWSWFIARSSGIRLPFVAILAMGVAVWMLYAADRLLDARSLTSSAFAVPASARSGELEARHHFHRHHQQAFRAGLALASLVLACLVPQLAEQSIRLYAILGAPLLAYFILIHSSSSRPANLRSPRVPKEIAVGIFFSAAAFIPTVARNPALRAPLLPIAALLGIVCSLNCLFIYAWEHPAGTADPPSEPHPATRFSLRFLPALTALAILACLGLAISDSAAPWPLPAAIAAAAASLLLLHRNRHQLSSLVLRAAADLCLLTPLLFLPALAH
jgi:hypothetical protein